MTDLVPIERITDKILLIRGEKVILDSDLALLYGVETKRLNQQVSRNRKRFPTDFMFELTNKEKEQVVANCDHLQYLKFSPYNPKVFSEQGVAMLSSVLHSDKAIEINILIMRAFVRLRELLYSNRELALRVERLEREMRTQGDTLNQVVELVTQLLQQPEEPRRRIGF